LHENDDVPMQTSYDDTPPDAGPGSQLALTVWACANVDERVSSEQARMTSRRLRHGALHHTSSIQLLRKRTSIVQKRASACKTSSQASQFRRQSVLDPSNALWRIHSRPLQRGARCYKSESVRDHGSDSDDADKFVALRCPRSRDKAPARVREPCGRARRTSVRRELLRHQRRRHTRSTPAGISRRGGADHGGREQTSRSAAKRQRSLAGSASRQSGPSAICSGFDRCSGNR
jgi:hypothetical protein